MSSRRLSLIAQQVFWVALLVVPVVFSTRSFEAFLTVKQFLASSFLWLGACMFFGACARGGARLPRSILAYALLALILELLISTIHAQRLPAAVFSFFTIVPFGVGLVFCTSAASSPTFRRVSRTVILSASAVGAVYGLLQYLQLDPLAYFLDLWVRTEGKRSIFSTFGNPNFLAEFLVLSFPLALAARCASTSELARAMLIRLLILDVVAIVACGSRGVWVGLIVSTGLFVVLTWLRCPAYRKQVRRAALAIVLVGAAGTALMVAFGSTSDEAVGARVRMLGNELGISGRARLLAWRTAFEEMIPRTPVSEGLLALAGQHLRPEQPRLPISPWLGSGLGSFYLDFLDARGRYFARIPPAIYRDVVGAMNYDRLHNEYLQVLVEGGLLGAVIVVAVLLAGPVVFLRRLRTDTEPRKLERIGAFCAFAGPAAQAFVSFPAHLASTAIAVIFVLGCVLSPSEDDEPWAESATEGKPAGLALIVAALIATVGISVLIRPFLADIARKEVESTSNGLALEFDRESVDAGLRLEPLNGPLHFALAKEAYTRRDYAMAEREANLALQGINDVSLHSLLGIACLSQGKFDEARKHLNDAATMSGGDPQILYYKALAAASSGVRADALRDLEALLRDHSGFAEAWLLLGDLHAKAREFDKALPCFLEATGADPNSAKAWFLLALTQHELGRMSEAKASLAKTLELDPNNARAAQLKRILDGQP